MQAHCQLQWRPTFLPSNFYFLRAWRGGRSHHATNYESSAKCSADIRAPLAPPFRKCRCGNMSWPFDTDPLSALDGQEMYRVASTKKSRHHHFLDGREAGGASSQHCSNGPITRHEIMPAEQRHSLRTDVIDTSSQLPIFYQVKTYTC
ncbi:hypothetical protein ACJJTC_017751 [Scirpophaga incertulas]